MSWRLHRPSFWPEPGDPWAWQRALAVLRQAQPVPDPWPCWEQHLRGKLSRRAVPGLFGLRAAPAPPTVLGMGLLSHDPDGWRVNIIGEALIGADRDSFPLLLAEQLVRRSAWVRLALQELARGRWTLPRGIAPLLAGRQMRAGEDLTVPADANSALPEAAALLGDLAASTSIELRTEAPVASLSALHSPLYLLYTLGWLDAAGQVRLPDPLMASLRTEAAAGILRRITEEERDGRGFVPISRAARRLWAEVHGAEPPRSVDAWVDQVFGAAIASGAIEVDAWLPGQPRHGRGLFGDRDRKLVRWTIHDDFTLSVERANTGQPLATTGAASGAGNSNGLPREVER
jgi:hypothetical protein